ncbi:cell division protein FtsK [Streptomyces sp. WAC05858]|uniref:cell division protein FtsK n=1 Tax=Streptomyces TaxID=1883 RepID=UPI000F78C4D3|nr:cell division protein FtsK [Streptomyces sp. WAC05858]RSS47571.1 cell division protein FtsK [Streptomyces sp. WAC05858]
MTDTYSPAVPAAPGTPTEDVPAPGTPSLAKASTPPAPVPAEDETGQPVPVDNPNLPDPEQGTEVRRPILPAWLKDQTEFTTTAGNTVDRAWYTIRYHAVRTLSGVYAARLAARSPIGAARFIKATGKWIWDREAAPLRGAAVRDENATEYMTLSRQRNDRVKLRLTVSLIAAVFGLGFALTLYVMAPAWLYVFSCAGILTLGYFGQKEDAPVIGPAVLPTDVQKLTAGLVLRGLNAIGNAKISAAIKKGGDMDGMRFTSEITRDGPGYRADLDLPYGITPEDVMEERQALASGLRRKVGCVWPSGDPDEHEGRLVLWVGDRPMNETTKPAWPLLKDGRVDLFKPIIFGNDQRMRWVEVTLMFASVVIGSIPRMGKTFLLRLLLLICALDPRAALYAFDLKGTGDLGALEPVLHRYRAGEEDEDIEYILHALREIKEELRRRAKVIKSLPRTRCPESKVTAALSNDKSLGLHPIAIGIDECQVVFEHEKYGAEIESICTDITKRGPALGIIGLFATQRPDAKSLPPGISANAVLRFCLKVMNHQANDMVLGTGAYKAGIRATMFSRRDLGICFMSGEGDDPRIVASAFVDGPKAELVVTRARKMREEYGNITGHAIGEGPEKSAGMDILGDVLKVIPADEDKVWCERIAARLAERWPDMYGEWKGEQITTALKPWDVRTGQVWGTTDDGEGKNRRGIERADIVRAITKRDTKKHAA